MRSFCTRDLLERIDTDWLKIREKIISIHQKNNITKWSFN